MEKEVVKIIGIFIIFGLLSISMFSIIKAYSWEDFGDDFVGIFNRWNNNESLTNQGTLFVKILFTIMITLLVFSILDMTGLFNNKAALFLIAVIVGILGTYYMSQKEVLTLTNLYSALGGTLLTLVPFIILSGFTIRAVIDGNLQLMVLQHIAWALFTVFLIYTLFQNFSALVLVIAILSGILTFGNSSLLQLFQKQVLGAKVVASTKNLRDIETGMSLLQRLGFRMGQDTNNKYF
jgi:hypothetical protein